MLESLFLTPLFIFAMLGAKWFFYTLYLYKKYGICYGPDYYGNSKVKDILGVFLYLNIIFRININLNHGCIKYDVADILIFLLKYFAIVFLFYCYFIESNFIFHTNIYTIITSFSISLMIVCFYYFIKFKFKIMENELYRCLYDKNEIKLIDWIEKYKKSFLFKDMIPNFHDDYLTQVYQKWNLHKDLQNELILNSIKAKRTKL